MNPTDELRQLNTDNQILLVQLEELNSVLFTREQEIAGMRKNKADITELKSILVSQLEAIQSMQNQIGEKDQQAEGAVERELVFLQELTEAAGLQLQFNDMVQEYHIMLDRYSILQEQFNLLKLQNAELLMVSGRIGELESQLTNTVMEKDLWAARFRILERSIKEMETRTGN